MGRNRGDTEFLADIELFSDICEILERFNGECSFAKIAHELQIPASTLNSCRNRLESDLGVSLFNTVAKSGKNTLSDHGRNVLREGQKTIDQLRSLRNYPRDEVATVHFIASHSLLVHLYPAVVRPFLRRKRPSNVDITLKIDDHDDLVTTLAKVAGGEADFAVLFDIEDREEAAKRAGLVYYRFAKKLDLVVIFGRDNELVNRLSANTPVKLEELAKQTILCLHGMRQPLFERLPLPEKGGQKIVLDHFSTIIEFINAGHKGVAIVPGLYRELDYYRKTGNLFHLPIAPLPSQKDGDPSKPAILSVAAVFRGSRKSQKEGEPPKIHDYDFAVKDTPARDLLMDMDTYLSDALVMTSGWNSVMRSDTVGQAFSRLQQFRYGAYLWCRDTGIDLPVWRHLDVTLQPPLVEDMKTVKGVARIAGEPDDCRLSCKLRHGAMFQVRFRPANPSWTMLATFNMTCVAPEDGVDMIAGTWSGQDKRGKPLAGPILLATRQLEYLTLLRYNRAAMLRVLNNVNVQLHEVEKDWKAT